MGRPEVDDHLAGGLGRTLVDEALGDVRPIELGSVVPTTRSIGELIRAAASVTVFTSVLVLPLALKFALNTDRPTTPLTSLANRPPVTTAVAAPSDAPITTTLVAPAFFSAAIAVPPSAARSWVPSRMLSLSS